MKDFIILSAYGKEMSAIRKESIDVFFIDENNPEHLIVWVNGCVYNLRFVNSEECEKMFQSIKNELSDQNLRA